VAQTFDIRFAKTAGLAGFFEAPGNRFGWKGSGKLSIDAQGISVAVKRSLTNLFARRRSHRVAAGEITQVYREGDALRLEFGSESQRHILPIWATGRSDAEQIVKLLPTSSTVELEHAPDVKRVYKFDWRLFICLAVMTVIFVIAGTALQWNLSRHYKFVPAPWIPGSPGNAADGGASARHPSVAPEEKSPALQQPAVNAGAGTSGLTGQDKTSARPIYGDADPMADAMPFPPNPELVDTPATDSGAAAATVVAASRPATEPVTRKAQGDEISYREYRLYMAELNSLRADYLYARDRLGRDRFAAVEAGWWKVTERVVQNKDFDDIAYIGQRELELAISRAWRAYLSGGEEYDRELIESLERQLGEQWRAVP
jgi:hypothetical protein